MATAQVFLALCVASVAVAAPQLGRPRSATGTGNEQQVVSSVITALGPSISKAVEEALAGLNGASARAAEEQRRQQLLIQQQQQEAAARREQIRLQEQRRQQQAEKASFEAELSADLGPQARPVYNFEYKVADDQAQTYMTRNEERDGDQLVGKYSYVDATGALINVEYTAGVDGYQETRTKEDGFVQMRAVEPWSGPLAGVDDVGTGAEAARDSTTAFASGSRGSSSFGSSSSSRTSSSRSQSDLIASIIAALQPQIASAVTAAIN